jgi:hypothetical protein
VSLADFDRDGDLDIAFVSVNLSSASWVSVFLGRGDGQFDAPADYATGTASQGIDAADVDRDGDVDLVVANYATGDFSFLAGNGDGTFAAAVPVALPEGTGPIDAVLRDFDRDGRLDVLVTDLKTPRVVVVRGLGDGTFGAATVVPLPAGASYAAVADLFGGDGLDDVAVMGVDGSLHLLRNGPVAAGDVDADAADWGTIVVGDAADAARTVTVRNEGDATLRVTGLAVVGTNFALAAGQATSFDVAPGGSADVALVCNATSPGPCGATLRITSNDPDEPTYDVALTAAPATYLVTPAAGTLGTEITYRGPVGARGAAQLRSGRKRVTLKLVEWTPSGPLARNRA